MNTFLFVVVCTVIYSKIEDLYCNIVYIPDQISLFLIHKTQNLVSFCPLALYKTKYNKNSKKILHPLLL